MAAGIASYLANAWLNTIRGGGAGTSYTAPAAVYAALHISTGPGAAGTSNNSAGSTLRVAVTEGAASGGAIALTNSPLWTNGGASETLTFISLWDALTSGNFLCSLQLTSSQAWAATNTFTLTSLGISLTPLAS